MEGKAMIRTLLFSALLMTMLSGCAYMVAGGAGYVVGRELEEEQGVDEPEVYK